MMPRLSLFLALVCIVPHFVSAQPLEEAPRADSSRLYVGVSLHTAYNRDRTSPLGAAGWWQGRGLNQRTSLEARYATPWMRVRLAPERQYAQNLDIPQSPLGASPFQYPMREGTIDLPPRLGEEAFTRWDAGRTEVAFLPGGMEVALSHAPPPVGGGRWMGLLSGRGAPGFWHVRVGTAAPVKVFGAQMSGYLLSGRAENSAFALNAPGASRPLYRAGVEVVPFAQEPGLRVHAASATVWNGRDESTAIAQLFSPLTLPFSPASRSQRALVLTSIGVQWSFPEDQLDLYAELLSQGGRRSASRLLESPLEGKGWMLGLRKGWTPSPDLHLALGVEWANLEANKDRLVRPPITLYADSLVTQGYTHRGLPLGAWIGPGSNSQIVDLSVASRGLTLMAYGMRWTHDNDRYYQYFLPQPNPTNYQKHEVELILGAQLAYRRSQVQVGASYAHAVLYNRFYGLRDEFTDNRNGFFVRYYLER